MEELRHGYRAHNAHIRNLVPKKRLLEYHASQGWKPLCDFLGKQEPAEPMIKVNEGTQTADLHVVLAKQRFEAVMTAFLKKAAPIAMLAAAWWAYQRYGGV